MAKHGSMWRAAHEQPAGPGRGARLRPAPRHVHALRARRGDGPQPGQRRASGWRRSLDLRARRRGRASARRPAAARRARVRFRADAGYLLVADSARRASTSRSPTSPATILDARGRAGRHRAPGPDVDPRRGSRRSSRSCTAQRRPAPGELWGIGIGVPGPVEFDAGRPISPPIMPGWDGYHVPRALRALTASRSGSTTTST